MAHCQLGHGGPSPSPSYRHRQPLQSSNANKLWIRACVQFPDPRTRRDLLGGASRLLNLRSFFLSNTSRACIASRAAQSTTPTVSPRAHRKVRHQRLRFQIGKNPTKPGEGTKLRSILRPAILLKAYPVKSVGQATVQLSNHDVNKPIAKLSRRCSLRALREKILFQATA